MLPYSKSTIFTVGLVTEMSNSEYLFKHGNSIFIIQYLFRRSDKNKELSTSYFCYHILFVLIHILKSMYVYKRKYNFYLSFGTFLALSFFVLTYNMF